jgi:large subunit ribosomal protein L2
MGKRIISQARGHGSLIYRVRKKAYRYRVAYPDYQGKAEIIKIIHSPSHTAPLIKLKIKKDKEEVFYNVAFKNSYIGQEISLGKGENAHEGDVLRLKEIEQGKKVYNIETSPGNGGKLIRTSGSSAEVVKKEGNKVFLLLPSKKSIPFNENCRATVGVVAGAGRKEKPVMKAGNRHYAMKAKGRKWHFTSAVKTNAIDHPFGGGRGKRIKSKIAKRNSPPGAKVGHLRPRKTGKKK